MVTSKDGTPEQLKIRGTEWRTKSFETVVREDFERLDRCGLIPYWDMSTKQVNVDVFESFSESTEEKDAWDRYMKDCIPLNTGSHSLLARGLYALQLGPWLQTFDSNQFLILELSELSSNGVHSVMERVWRHLDLPPFSVPSVEARNVRPTSTPISKDMRSELKRFYAPHNRRLKRFLTKWNLINEEDDPVWSDLIWDDN
mmetsp:Transcript_17699/g.41057  ORF Transcript_17699/g.41057 Transcript_17699/m.41057 type:complete len:200 (-) Transcript_17699:903-1502(-)